MQTGKARNAKLAASGGRGLSFYAFSYAFRLNWQFCPSGLTSAEKNLNIIKGI
jgi:hypothetical protein